MGRKKSRVMRFRITLNGIQPAIWRLIEVPESYTFWDLHVAIQDSMGWLDYHLHQFDVRRGRGGPKVMIGIPDDEYEDQTIAGWEVELPDCFMEVGDTVEYEYDFGDGWSHQVTLEGLLLKETGRKYPTCIDGERACPPEDCGGLMGYEELLEVLNDPSHEEYQGMVEWLKGHAKKYWPYDSDRFDPEAVKFDNPRKRFKRAFMEP